ncbi:MAG: ParB N-terminal domain-containing protein [archaeon]|nr:ParB N-terminal domain-containing protein [archaeon]
MKRKNPPPIIQEVGFDFHWDIKKVWALNYPVEEINISELSWHFDIPFWKTQNGYYDLTPNEVIKDKEKFKQEFERTMKADLSHSIDIMQNKGKWLILDGLHRLVKAKILGYKKVSVRKIPRNEIPNIEK